MLKLKQMQAKKAAEEAAKSGESTDDSVKRQTSKELAAVRQQKSKESVFSLRKGSAKGSGKKTNAAELRAQKDVAEMEVPQSCVVDFPNPDDIMNFTVHITPADGLYEGAKFHFTVQIPSNYPYVPPKVHCETLVYHPNIDWEGHVCLNILRADWMPVLNLGSVIFGLMTLFLEPNPDDPLNKEAAALMVDNIRQFENNVRSSLRGGYVLGRQFPRLL